MQLCAHSFDQNQLLQGPTVLVVEDDTVLRELLADVLSTEGYSVLQAGSGQEGLRLAEKHRPAVILLDQVLPRGSGMEILRQLQAEELTRYIPVVLVSGSAVEIQEPDPSPAGILPKPFDLEALLTQVSRLVS
jgi:CheY-like chemotaxis protein